MKQADQNCSKKQRLEEGFASLKGLLGMEGVHACDHQLANDGMHVCCALIAIYVLHR